MNNFDQVFHEQYEMLNSEQKEAVDSIEGPVMVLAGPGTGKTQILALRIARILQVTDMYPHNILCLTFTETGVVEMRKRLLKFIGPDAYHVRIYTFHSFCNDVLQDFPEKFLMKRDVQVISDIDKIKIFQEIIDNLPVDSVLKPFSAPYFYRRDLEQLISDLKRESVSIEDFKLFLKEIEVFLKVNEQVIEEFIGIHGMSLNDEHIQTCYNCFIKEDLKKSNQIEVFKAIFRDFFNCEFEDEKLLKKARTKLKNSVKDFWNRLKNNYPKHIALIDIYEVYQKILKERGLIDFNYMICFVVQKFKEDRDLLSYYQEQFQYVLIDEYQDTNGAQNEAIKLLGEFFESPNVFVVGDDKQSIYRFQGASLENVLSFYKKFKTYLKLIKLKNNYRSSQNILDAAHSVISHNAHNIDNFIEGISSSLEAAKEKSMQKVQIFEFDNISEENYFVAKKIESLIKEGVNPNEIAVLYRNNSDSIEIAKLLEIMHVPFYLQIGEDILKNLNILKILDLMELLENPWDSALYFRVLNFDFLNFNFVDNARLSLFASKNKKTFFTLTQDVDFLRENGIKFVDKYQEFSNYLAKWRSDSINYVFSDFFEILIKESGYLDYILKSETKIEDLNRLKTLFEWIKEVNKIQKRMNLKQILEDIELLRKNNAAILQESLKLNKDAVTLMTTHRAKGTEFEHVFIIKCVDKHFGNSAEKGYLKLPRGIIKDDVSFNVQEKNEDERRLFYVAMTRAKKCLYLTYANKNEKNKMQAPCIFLVEIDEKFVERHNEMELSADLSNRLELFYVNKKADKEVSSEIKDYLRTLTDNYVMSVTHLNNYLDCSKKFYYQNLLKVPSAKSKDAVFGTAVHEALKDLLNSFKEGKLADKEFFLQRFEYYLGKEVLTEQEFEDSLNYGKLHLCEYFDYYKKDLKPNILLEYSFAGHGVNVDGLKITGRLDKLEILDNIKNTVHVVDFKTGNPDNKISALSMGGDYRRQIAFYQLLCDSSPRFPYKMVSGEINFVQKSKKDNDFKNYRMEISEQELRDLKKMIGLVYEEISRLYFLEKPGCGKCEWCEMKG